MLQCEIATDHEQRSLVVVIDFYKRNVTPALDGHMLYLQARMHHMNIYLCNTLLPSHNSYF